MPSTNTSGLVFLEGEAGVVDGDRAEYSDYETDDYDLYSYEEDIAESRSVDETLPTPAMLRQRRPFRKYRRRPNRKGYLMKKDKFYGGRNPQIYQIPGRIQSVPEHAQGLPGRPPIPPVRDQLLPGRRKKVGSRDRYNSAYLQGDGNRLPSGGGRDRLPGGGRDRIKGVGDRTPVSGERIKGGGDRIPGGSNRIKGIRDRYIGVDEQIPASGDRIPGGGGRDKISADRLPGGSNRFPGVGDRFSSSGSDRIPAGDNRLTGDRKRPFGDDKRVGGSRKRVPYGGSRYPDDSDRLSVNGNSVDDSLYGESFNSRPSVERGQDCDFYTDSLCLNVNNYPQQEIKSLLGTNRRVSSDMIADVMEQSADDLIDGVSSNQENTYTYSHYFGDRRDDTTHKHRDFAQEGGFLCPSEIKYAKPKRGKTAQGTWKDIVNVNDYTQTLRMEKCLQPGGTCSYVSHHYKSQCSQIYNYHRLLSWSKERGLHMDIYKVPTCCSCHIMGYSYVYPPLGKGGSTAANTSPAVSFSAHKPQSKPSPPKLSPPKLSIPSSIDNFIPDFNPQAELEQFMQTISSDIRDFNTFGKSNKRPVRQQGPVAAAGFSPSLGPDLAAPPRPVRTRDILRRRGQLSSKDMYKLYSQSAERAPIRRGDGFSPAGDPSVDATVQEPGQEDGGGGPGHKYESIPLESDTDSSDVINYGYHPIIDFFNE